MPTTNGVRDLIRMRKQKQDPTIALSACCERRKRGTHCKRSHSSPPLSSASKRPIHHSSDYGADCSLSKSEWTFWRSGCSSSVSYKRRKRHMRASGEDDWGVERNGAKNIAASSEPSCKTATPWHTLLHDKSSGGSRHDNRTFRHNYGAGPTIRERNAPMVMRLSGLLSTSLNGESVASFCSAS